MQKALFQELIEKLDEARVDKAKVVKAIEFAGYHHAGQKRLTGEDFVCHPLKVAISSTENDLKQDTDIIVASLLHDVVEDTGVKIADIWREFDCNVAELVEGLSRKNRISAETANIVIDSLIDKFHAPIIKNSLRQVKLFTKEKTIVPYFAFADALLNNLKDITLHADGGISLDLFCPSSWVGREESMANNIKRYAVYQDYCYLFEAVRDILLTTEMLGSYKQDDEELSVIDSLTHVFNNYDEKTVNKICLIKTLDRLDNLASIHVFDEDKQKRIKQNTIRDILPLVWQIDMKILVNKITYICNYDLTKNNFQFVSALSLLGQGFKEHKLLSCLY